MKALSRLSQSAIEQMHTQTRSVCCGALAHSAILELLPKTTKFSNYKKVNKINSFAGAKKVKLHLEGQT